MGTGFSSKITLKKRIDANKTPKFVKQLQNITLDDFGKSIRVPSRELNVVKRTALSSVHEDIRYNFYMLRN